MDTIDKRLLTLFSFDAFAAPISREQIASLIVSTTKLSWIDVQLTIESLVEDGLLEDFKDTKVELTPKGKQVVDVYNTRIPISVKNKITDYIKNNRDQLLRETLSRSNFEAYKDNYKVYLELIENSVTLVEMSLLVPDRKNAERICNNWKKQPQKIYRALLESVSND